jgi:hypothetical protein
VQYVHRTVVNYCERIIEDLTVNIYYRKGVQLNKIVVRCQKKDAMNSEVSFFIEVTTKEPEASVEEEGYRWTIINGD